MISDVLSKVAFFDELSRPPEFDGGTSGADSPLSSEPEPINPNDFSEEIANVAIESERTAPQEEKETPPDEPPYDASREAKKIVGTWSALNIITLNPIAGEVLARKRGGKTFLANAKKAYHNREAGNKLSEQEQKWATTYENYLNSRKELAMEIPFTVEEKAALQEMAELFCEETKFKMSSKGSFFITGIGIQVTKIVKILSA